VTPPSPVNERHALAASPVFLGWTKTARTREPCRAKKSARVRAAFQTRAGCPRLFQGATAWGASPSSIPRLGRGTPLGLPGRLRPPHPALLPRDGRPDRVPTGGPLTARIPTRKEKHPSFMDITRSASPPSIKRPAMFLLRPARWHRKPCPTVAPPRQTKSPAASARLPGDPSWSGVRRGPVL